jgi:hypothetical protein
MRRIRQVLQMHFGARTSARVIAHEVGVGRSTVQDYVARANGAKLGWPLPAELTDERLEQLLFPASSATPGARRHPEPDWAALVREMKRPAVSLMILWDEYNAVHPQGYGYRRKRDSRLAITPKISLPPFASLTVEYSNDPAKEKDCSATIRMSCVFRVVAAFCR